MTIVLERLKLPYSCFTLLVDNLCNRLWSFERFPNKILRGLDNAIIYTANKEACLSACLNEVSSTIDCPANRQPFRTVH